MGRPHPRQLFRSGPTEYGRRAFLGGLGACLLSSCGGSPGSPSGAGVASLSGRVLSVLDPSRAMARGRVFVGTQNVGTIVEGSLSVPELPVGRSQLTLSSTEYLDRRVAVEIGAPGPNRLPDVTVMDRDIAGYPLDAQALDEMLRTTNLPSATGNVTARWVETPQVFVHRPSLVGGQSLLGTGRSRLELVREALTEYMPVLSDGLFDGRWSEVDDLEAFPPIRTPGTILVQGSDDIGLAGLTFSDANARFEMQWCVVALSSSFVDSTPAHELMHTLHTSHTERMPSLMATQSNATLQPTVFDYAFTTYLYRRPPGSAGPDDTTAVETLRAVPA